MIQGLRDPLSRSSTLRTVMLLLLSNCIGTAWSQAGPGLVVRGDDMGYSHSGNLALIRSSVEGIQQSIELLVPSPWYPEAVKMLKEQPGIEVGIHLALTSEWENVKWRPLSDCPSLKDSNGYFLPMVSPNINYPGQSIRENKWTIRDVEKEFRAQIEQAQRSLPGRITHLSSHMGICGLTPDVMELTRRLAREYNIPVDPSLDHLNGVGYDGPHGTAEEKISSFISMLDRLEAGTDYVFLDHPGLDDAELQAIWHLGYEKVAEDRQGVTDLFTSERVKAAIRAKNIRLLHYTDLQKIPFK